MRTPILSPLAFPVTAPLAHDDRQVRIARGSMQLTYDAIDATFDGGNLYRRTTEARCCIPNRAQPDVCTIGTTWHTQLRQRCARSARHGAVGVHDGAEDGPRGRRG